MFYKLKFYLGLSIINFKLIKEYRYLSKTNRLTREEYDKFQNNNLRNIINYSYNNIPYYKKMFDNLGLKPSDILTTNDLYKIPILKKEDILANIDEFYPLENNIAYANVSTGGSTGQPLKYRISKQSSDIGFALLLRGWELGTYKVGDKVVIIAGGSLIGKKQSIKSKIVDYILNFKSYSSYGINQDLLMDYSNSMIKWNPKHIRGYASAVFLLAEYINKNKLNNNFNLKGIYTTSEMLFEKQRIFIEKVFNCKVFDTYGLNDGAISAFECKEHTGMHIDMERGLLEVVNCSKQNIYNKEGKILATTLDEYAMPLIRYDTGDLGVLSDEECVCGICRPILKELRGRVTDTLNFNGTLIASPVITVLMGKVNVLQYQFIQIKKNKLKIKILKSENYTKDDEKFIINSLHSHVGSIEILFDYVDNFLQSNDKKHKFIIKMVDKI
jgi:phenylacetate-CoA ligase